VFKSAVAIAVVNVVTNALLDLFNSNFLVSKYMYINDLSKLDIAHKDCSEEIYFGNISSIVSSI